MFLYQVNQNCRCGEPVLSHMPNSLIAFLIVVALTICTGSAHSKNIKDQEYTVPWYYSAISVPEDLGISPPSRPVTVAIIDDGFRITHNDLKDFLYQNPNEEPENGIDDDGNGYMDDIHGWDVADGDNIVTPPSREQDTFYHGTHIASIITRLLRHTYGNNAPQLARLMLIKSISDRTRNTYLKSGFDGIQYAIDQGADIILCAWGVSHISSDEKAILNSAAQQGILIVASGGNLPEEKPQYPAAHDGVIAVGSINRDNVKVKASNYGAFLDVSAPGENIPGAGIDSDEAVAYHSGSSFAAALVTGVLTILKIQSPNQMIIDYKALLLNSATPLDKRNPDYTAKLGAGKINLNAALELAKTAHSLKPDQEISIVRPKGFLSLTQSRTWQIGPFPNVKGFHIRYHHAQDTSGKLQLYRSNDASPWRSIKLNKDLRSLYIPGNWCKIVFTSSATPGGAYISYIAEPVQLSTLYCSETKYIDTPVTLSDGSGDNEYSPNSSCKWIITAPPGKLIRFSFSQFDTQAQTDKIYLFDGDKTNALIMAVLSGQTLPPPIVSWHNIALLWFVSDASGQGKGWQCNISFVDK